MKKSIFTTTAALLVSATLVAQTAGQKKILFDCTHAETSGNGDWCIDADTHNLNWGSSSVSTSGNESNPAQYPTPTQTAVTSSTAETYWEGALSNWAIDCVNKNYWVETLPYNGHITYGSSTNLQDLSKYNVFVVDEPNTIFTTAEKTAMMNFIKNGGSLFMISDHTGSDRNNDGYDSPAIWNDFITNNSVQNNAFGFKFELQNFSDNSYTSNVASSTYDSITHGQYGNVTEVKWSNGTCMTITPAQNASAKGHTWKNGKGQTDTAVTSVTARYGCGKVAAIGDSSPPDDGTGNPSASLYNGYTSDANGNHRPWLMNMMIWLAEGGTCNQVTTGVKNYTDNASVTVYPNPMQNQLTVQLPFVAQKAKAVLCDLLGNQITSTEISEGSNLTLQQANLQAGVYLVMVTANNTTLQPIKVIKQ
ncbi:MAG TPA: T9SS type A sorting domain-containing protein [Bacteroidia bacterium]|nr:T9SS type A sorting domain-containing protein [Bacteroidia bacterium]